MSAPYPSKLKISKFPSLTTPKDSMFQYSLLNCAKYLLFQKKNNLCLWGINGSNEEEYFDNEAGDGEPDLLCSVEHYGSVTDMQV